MPLILGGGGWRWWWWWWGGGWLGAGGVLGATLIVHNHGIKIKKSGGLYDVATVTHIVPLMTASAHIFWVIICSPDSGPNLRRMHSLLKQVAADALVSCQRAIFLRRGILCHAICSHGVISSPCVHFARPAMPCLVCGRAHGGCRFFRVCPVFACVSSTCVAAALRYVPVPHQR